MCEIRKRVSLSKNPKARITFQISHKNVFYEFSGLGKKGSQKFKKTDKKSGRISISIGLTQKN